MNISKIPLFVLVLLIGPGAGTSQPLHQPQSLQQNRAANPGLSISATAAEDVVKVGAQVRLKVSLKNISNREIMVSADGYKKIERDYMVRVTDDRGNVPPLTKYGRAVINNEDVVLTRPSSMTLGPGETRNEELIVTSLFDLSKPGKYSIQLERFDDSVKADVKSNVVTITVNP